MRRRAVFPHCKRGAVLWLLIASLAFGGSGPFWGVAPAVAAPCGSGAASADLQNRENLPAVSATEEEATLTFEENNGQTDATVRYLSRWPDYTIFLTAQEAVLSTTKLLTENKNAHTQFDFKNYDMSAIVRMHFLGANQNPAISGIDLDSYTANRSTGSDSASVVSIPHFARVKYADVCPGVDLVYYGNRTQLEYDFLVSPGADPNQIVIVFQGADVQIAEEGDLLIKTLAGDLIQRRPIIYQELGDRTVRVEGKYVRKGPNRVGFEVATYDTSEPLIIDPLLVLPR